VERLCKENYIDALALIRRSTFAEVGGFDGYFCVSGWEDYELWLRLAAAGHRAEFVPGFVGWYRVHQGSRQETVNLDAARLMSELRDRYPFLPWHGE
jgi:GT2 family glycosyltransferase